MNDMGDRKLIALSVIDEACEEHQCDKVFALFSGGDDSLAALRVAIEHPNFVAAVHCNTGVGVEATREFARETCRKLRCPLIEYKAVENVNGKGESDPQIYEQMVMEYGFPGPTKFGHGKMYNRLKERGLRRLMREHTTRPERVVFTSGCRSDESTRRMGTTKKINPDGRRIWVNHIHNWTKIDTLQFREHCGLERNPVSKLICMSGECKCGGYANAGGHAVPSVQNVKETAMPLTEYDSLVARALEDVAQDAPRFVLADWLEENSMPIAARDLRWLVGRHASPSKYHELNGSYVMEVAGAAWYVRNKSDVLVYGDVHTFPDHDDLPPWFAEPDWHYFDTDRLAWQWIFERLLLLDKKEP